MPSDAGISLVSGKKALEAGKWTQAREAFREALAVEESPEALEGLGEALWWLGDVSGTVSCFERGYRVSRARADHARAGAMALRNALHARFYQANETAAAGWVARAKRLVEEHRLEELRGEVLVIQSCCADDPPGGEKHAREALEMARRKADPDLELCALSTLGLLLVRQGRIDDGLSLLDEAWAAALSGEGKRLETIVFAGCDYMTSCSLCAAFERALNGIRAMERFARRYGCPFLYAECRLVYCDVLLAIGDWSRAEKELRAAIESTRDSAPAYHAWALAGLAEMRLAQGGLEEAERLVLGYEGYPKTIPLVTRMHLLRGAPAAAAYEARRRLEIIGNEELESALLLELLGEAEHEQGNRTATIQYGRRLAELGASRGCRVMTARGERLWGRGLSASDSREARRHCDAALALFMRLNMPYEAARTRFLLAEILRLPQPRVAAREGRAALATFDRLGAARDADAAAGFLRRLRVRSGRGAPKGLQPLTKRERQVFGLLGEGLSNPEIARRLFISRKTAEHHVCNILGKTGLRSRAEAAAASVRQNSSLFAKK